MTSTRLSGVANPKRTFSLFVIVSLILACVLPSVLSFGMTRQHVVHWPPSKIPATSPQKTGATKTMAMTRLAASTQKKQEQEQGSHQEPASSHFPASQASPTLSSSSNAAEPENKHRDTKTSTRAPSDPDSTESDNTVSVDKTTASWLNSDTISKLILIATMTTLLLSTSSSIPVIASTATIFDSHIIQEWTGTGFYQAFSLVFLSEIGDKTFFIAGLLAMKTSRLVSFVGSMGALAAMTIVSVLIGQIFHSVPTDLTQGLPLDDIAAVVAFAFFGLKNLKEAFDMETDSSSESSKGGGAMDEELAEAEETVQDSLTIRQTRATAQIISTFGLVFAAEFGDRSFLSTIALSAAQNPIGVAAGAIAAHGVATMIAVAGGAVLAKYISEKAIAIVGGTLFLLFAITTAMGIF